MSSGRAEGRGTVGGHVVWLLAAALVGFFVSFLGTTVGSLPRHSFVLVHALVIGAFLVSYARWARFKASELRANWRLGVALGLVAALFSVNFVLEQPASPGLEGLNAVLGVLWLGIVYGLIDALLLTVLPVYSIGCIARRLGWLDRRPGRAGTALLALTASVAVTVSYHLGFAEFRGPEVLQPVIGNAIVTLAYILSGSPLAPLLAHVALHAAAVIHAYGTSIPLPPHY